MPGDSLRKNEKRRFSRVGCQFHAEFRLLDGAVWLSAEVLDFTIAGVRVCLPQKQDGLVLNETDIEWREACFRLRRAPEELLVKGHFLMVYQKEDGFFTTGVEFLDITPELQRELMRFYTERRCEAQ